MPEPIGYIPPAEANYYWQLAERQVTETYTNGPPRMSARFTFERIFSGIDLLNSRLKKLLAERDLDIEVLKEINAKNGEPAGST